MRALADVVAQAEIERGALKPAEQVHLLRAIRERTALSTPTMADMLRAALTTREADAVLLLAWQMERGFVDDMAAA